jgi:rubrerythrin
MRCSWKCALAVLAFVLTGAAGELSARDRSWHGPDGEVISRGDYFGVRGGQVILAEGSNKKFFPLSAFSLDDRDALIDKMKRSKHEIKIIELMQFENLKGQPQPAGAAGPGGDPNGETGTDDSATEAPGGAEALLSIGETTTQVYGLPVPFAGLLEEPPARTWTALLGQKMSAEFEELVAPAHITLRDINGRSSTFALVNFERADIDWLKETITADAQKDIFPAADPQPLTPEQTEKKYRAWTDRKGRTLNAAFTRVDGKQVVLETAAGPQSFPLIGLSVGDRDWIRQELLRRAEESRRRQEEAQRQAEQQAAASNSSGGAHGEGGGPFGGRNPFERSFRCYVCGHEWTSNRVIDHCPNCIEQEKQREAQELAGYEDRRRGSSFISYKFHCQHCGHKWVSNSAIEDCPNCDGRGNRGGGGGGGHGESASYVSNDSSSWTPGASSPPSGGGGYLSGSGTDMWICERCKHTFAHSGRPTVCPNCNNRGNSVAGIVVAAVVVIGAIISFVVRAVRN